MSLRTVHMLVIALASILAAATAVWLTLQSQPGSAAASVAGALLCGAAACGLATYGLAFFSNKPC